MPKVIIIGNGAREHVIAETLKNSTSNLDLFILGEAKNPGLFSLASEYKIGKHPHPT